jgi:hypothetical protein
LDTPTLVTVAFEHCDPEEIPSRAFDAKVAE